MGYSYQYQLGNEICKLPLSGIFIDLLRLDNKSLKAILSDHPSIPFLGPTTLSTSSKVQNTYSTSARAGVETFHQGCKSTRQIFFFDFFFFPTSPLYILFLLTGKAWKIWKQTDGLSEQNNIPGTNLLT